MKITGQIEQIFAHAVALDQSGGLRNSIYVKEKEVFIVNYDHTVMLRFRLRKSENPFEEPISFKANDYDSNEFEVVDGKIVFFSDEGGYERKKICGFAEHTPEVIKSSVLSFIKGAEMGLNLTISNKVLTLLDDSLSHIEFSGKAGESLKMIQRNIYSGGIIEISEKVEGMFDNELEEDFGPVGIKTSDFKALFTFQETLQFHFPNTEKEDYIIVKSVDRKKRDMTGILACCIYDEIIELQKSRKRGR